MPTFSYSGNDTLDEDSGSVIWNDRITDISAGPSNESYQHQDLEFSITTYDKFNNELQGINSNSPNNFLFRIPPTLIINPNDTNKAHLSFHLNENHNGGGFFEFNIRDHGGIEHGGVENTPIEDSYIFVKQNSDKSESFTVNPIPHEYAIDPTTFFIDTTSSIEYFRLPYQDFAPDVQIPEKMRFAWERNDSLDVDTYPTINLDTLYQTYYRLEMNADESDYTTINLDSAKTKPDDKIVTSDDVLNCDSNEECITKLIVKK